jgi:hypothetical protein
MPELTSEDAVSGLMGLMVVLARRNEAIPATLKNTLARTNGAQPARRRVADTGSSGVTNEIPHMPSAKTAATTGGGILSSSDVILTKK